MEKRFEEDAALFCEAIKALAKNDLAIENLECYLSRHFDFFCKRDCSSPGNLTDALCNFAGIEI